MFLLSLHPGSCNEVASSIVELARKERLVDSASGAVDGPKEMDPFVGMYVQYSASRLSFTITT